MLIFWVCFFRIPNSDSSECPLDKRLQLIGMSVSLCSHFSGRLN